MYLHGLGAMSSPYYLRVAADPALSDRRSLLFDFLGFGLSDRPDDFSYSLEAHADAIALGLADAGVVGAEVIGHSMGGAIAIVLAKRHPDLVGRLVLIEPNLEKAEDSDTAISSRIAASNEDEFVRRGFYELLQAIGPEWEMTMRLSHPLAIHRSATALRNATQPSMLKILVGLKVPRKLIAGTGGERPGRIRELLRGGVEIKMIPGAGHNVMLDAPQLFIQELAF